ncbi:11883_t:CDS:2, partial [Cetraspora pellucida]
MKETDSNFTSVFDITTQKWSIPVTSGNLTSIGRLYIHCVSLGNGIYVYGGGNSVFSMMKLDVSNFVWSTLPGIMAPLASEGYSATLLNNASILYIGGGQYLRTANPEFSYLSMDKLPLYNINDNTWSLVVTSGSIPSPRIDHGAVFIPQYNQILIFYGSNDNSIMALDTLKFVWSVAAISNIGGSSSSLYSFSSTLVGAYVLIAFGRYNNYVHPATNNIFLLDISQKDNYKWVTAYDPTKQLQPIQPIQPIPTTSASSPSNDSPSNIASIIGATFGGLAGLIVLITIAVLIVRRYGYPSHPDIRLHEQEISSHQPI